MPDPKDRPEYYIVKDYINHLLQGEVEAHGKLPSERDLCEKFAVNRNTVRHAMRIMEREGAVYSAGRRGWFASGRRLVIPMSRKFINFDRLVRSQDMQPGWEIIDQGELPAPEEVAVLLKVPEGTRLYFSNEVGLVDGRRVYYDENYFLAHRCPGILPKLTERPTTDVWREDYGIDVVREKSRLRPMALHSHLAKHLGVSTGTPGLFIRSTKTTPDNEIVWLEYTFWRSDAVELKL